MSRDAGHPDITLHDIRSLHAIVALERGAPIQDVQASMRRATAAMTMHYARQRAKGKVAEAIGGALTDAGKAVVRPFPTPTPPAPNAKPTPVPAPAVVAAEPVSQAKSVGPTRPGRPKGKRYPKDDAGVLRRQQRRVEGHRARLDAYLASRSTVSSTAAAPPKKRTKRTAV